MICAINVGFQMIVTMILVLTSLSTTVCLENPSIHLLSTGWLADWLDAVAELTVNPDYSLKILRRQFVKQLNLWIN